MIDQNLIDTGSTNLQASLNQRISTVSSDLYVIPRVLENAMLIKLQTYLESSSDCLWTTVENQEKLPRKKITWHQDTVIEELHEVFDSVTPQINDIFQTSNKFFWGISVWRDAPGYYIDWHVDNPDIDIAMQVYLYTDTGVGTVFKCGDQELVIPSQPNSAYLIQHHDQHRIPHRSESSVPDGTIRYSLYAVWSRFSKHVANT